MTPIAPKVGEVIPAEFLVQRQLAMAAIRQEAARQQEQRERRTRRAASRTRHESRWSR